MIASSLYCLYETLKCLLIQNYFKNKYVLITSVSSSDRSYLQFTFDFMTLTQNINISYLNKNGSPISESLDQTNEGQLENNRVILRSS